MHPTKNNFKQKIVGIYPVLTCIVLFLLALNIRWRILYEFCLLITDSDQLILWDAANDMHHGIFHEPCFYGQSYNPLIEPLFAQPFLFFGMPLHLALPITSWILGFLPYLLLSLAFIKQKKYLSVAFIFAYMLWLPLQFHVIDSIPRGFVPACAFATIGVFVPLFADNKLRFFWFGFLSLFSFTVSQNCVFLLVPVATFLWLDNIKNQRFYLHTIIGLLVALPLPLYIDWFYSTHPTYIVHPSVYIFDLNNFKIALSHIDRIFNFLTPDNKNKLLYITCSYLVFGGVCFYNKKFKQGISIVMALFVLFFSLSFYKTQDGTDSMFFSSVRIFLGVPVSFALFAYWAESSFKAISYNLFWKSVALTFFLAIGIICSSDRNRFFMDKLHKSYGDDDVVSVLPVKSYLQDCDNFNNLCKAYHTNLIILDAWPLGVNYMAPALNYKFKILSPRNERRTWDMQQEDTTIRQDFILLPQMPDSFGKTVHYGINIKSTYDPSAFLINTHGRKVFDILKDLDIKVVWH